MIQWNGVNSVNQNFGNAGTLNNQGAGATLTSLGSENIVLTTRGLSSTDTDGLLTFSTGRPQILGINSDNDNNAAQFESNFSEIWTFDFSKDVVFEQMVANAMGFDGETFGIDIGADGSYEYEWNRTGFTTGTGTVVAVSFGAADEYLATFGSGFSVPAGTDIAIAGLAGSIGIEALVISVPEPSSYALFAGILAMTGVVIRRRR